MMKRKFLIVSILSVFLFGMLLASVGTAHAKTVTMHPKMNKDQTKHIGKYTIEIGKYKNPNSQFLAVGVFYKDDRLRFKEYKVKTYYKYNGKKKITKWERGTPGFSPYYKRYFPHNSKITKVKIKFHHKLKRYFKYYQLYKNGRSLGEYCRSKTKIDKATIRETQRQKGGRITQKAVYGYK